MADADAEYERLLAAGAPAEGPPRDPNGFVVSLAKSMCLRRRRADRRRDGVRPAAVDVQRRRVAQPGLLQASYERNGLWLSFNVADVDAEYERLLAAGAPAEGPPRDPNGLRRQLGGIDSAVPCVLRGSHAAPPPSGRGGGPDGEAGVGYRMRAGFDLPPLMFNAEDLQALRPGTQIVRGWADADLARTASGQELFYLPDFFIREKTKNFLAELRRAVQAKTRLGSATRGPTGKLRSGRWNRSCCRGLGWPMTRTNPLRR